MNVEKVRRRLVRRILSPVEILYDISNHWFVVLLVACLATLALLWIVTSQPPRYECWANLQISPQPIDDDPKRPQPQGKGTDLHFLGEQISLLQSDSVIAK